MQQRLGSEDSLIRVLILARSVVMRAGLEALISISSDLEVVGSYADSETLAQQIEQLQPDVVLLEWKDGDSDRLMPLLNPNLERNALISPMDSLHDNAALSEAFSASATPSLVALVDDWQQASVIEALRSGVRGLLPADATAGEIVATIQAAAIGLTVLHPDRVEALLANLPAASATLPIAPNQALTAREIEVLGMLAEGLGNKAIARRLSLSEHTVKFHIGSIFSKLNASSRTEAVILGARQGLILL
ncbi:MAG: response regulator transcription factor [Kovacikia sp.]